ncbi:MAG: hypothetical protein H0V70_17605 [Ktedonobacteraceae bacterium]|nr:hypothetical protein [Ktedonobacteraceae bacterium]
MNKEDNRTSLIMAGFTEKQVEHLNQFRRKQVEKEQMRILAEQRRLEFARWLVTNGRLTDLVA